jgi:MFS superfamily sulfate permease-like transporter
MLLGALSFAVCDPLPLLPYAVVHVGIGASIDKLNPASEAERIQLTLVMSFIVGLVCATMGVLRFGSFWRTSPLACNIQGNHFMEHRTQPASIMICAGLDSC